MVVDSGITDIFIGNGEIEIYFYRQNNFNRLTFEQNYCIIFS